MECECNYCKNDLEFPMPQELVQRVLQGNVVLFAGSGISTENPDQSSATFYNEIRNILQEEGYPPFPELMSSYCRQPDGRLALISKIRERFSYFKSFRDFYRQMSRFHRAVRPLYMIQDIITTNWDDFFETEAGFEPFIYDNDIPFIDSSRRRLLKIHGSINNVGSIVATEEDYRASYKRLNDGPLGAYIKTLLSTKTIIYVGYSISDSNYQRLLKNISKMLGPLARHSYFVSPLIDEEHLEKLPIALTPIRTDGSYFFEQLRIHLGALLPDDQKITEDALFEECDVLLDAIVEIHNETADLWLSKRHPLSIFALSYQDGLIHALQRFQTQRKTDEYYNLHRVLHLFHGYEGKIGDYMDKDDHWNACYLRGYQAAILFLLVGSGSERYGWPPAIDLGFDGAPDTISKLRRYALKKIPEEFRDQASRIAARTGPDMVPDHTPYA